MDDLFSVFEDTQVNLKRASQKKSPADKSNSFEEKVKFNINDEIDSDDEPEEKKSKTFFGDGESLLEQLPQTEKHIVDGTSGCVHEIVCPKDWDFSPLRPLSTNPARKYRFELDSFQKESVRCLENNQSVLVSAHTSAGKTVVAEYAIAMSLRDKQRVIYTTPIKALSNQKFREMTEEFQDVGLMTGDITINPSASCLIMTTEILRSMLYRGSEIMREVAWVIFDEIHYLRDKERGVVWEETIILLPDNVHYVFLSATIPNASQFAEWICHLHKQPCNVVYTDNRPTPLQHYIYPAGGDGLHLVVNEKGDFREDNFAAAMEVLKAKSSSDSNRDKKKSRASGANQQSNIFKIVKMINERNFQPVIVFSFSKKECEAYALQQQKLDFNNIEEKQLVEEVFNNAIDCLSDEDKNLPQVEQMLPVLKRGIGIHHSGLLPILKETIEILFSEGLIKALFATETFAMGLNMPARTVVFTNARKFDGNNFRWISSGEYIQMSGRAGRRGIDDRGIVILMIDEKMDPEIGRNLLKGEADPLNSAFHLTYNMVLNLLRVEEINPEYMLEKSFFQFQHSTSIPKTIKKLHELQRVLQAHHIPNEESAMSYYKVRQQLERLRTQLHQSISAPKFALPFMQPGRLVHVKHEEMLFGWGVVVNFQKKTKQKIDEPPIYIVEVLLNVEAGTERPRPPVKDNDKNEMTVVPVLLTAIDKFSCIRVYIPKDLRSRDNRRSVRQTIEELKNRFSQGIPLLDPIDDMGIEDAATIGIIKKIEALEQRMFSHVLHNDPQLPRLFDLCDKKNRIDDEIQGLKTELRQSLNIIQMEELKCRKRVLRRLGYASSSDVIELKGRVACHISSGDELVLTEMMFNGVFNDLTVEQCVAILICFTFQEKGSEMPAISPELQKPLSALQEIARRVAKVSADCKLDIDEDDYVQSFRPNMMEIALAWANNAPFAQLCGMTEIFEGSIIRAMRRLEELLREMCNAAKSIGNNELENKFAEGITKIKRDIVFAASLYL